MTIEVLNSAMHQSELSIIDRCNVHSWCLVMNQTDHEDYREETREYGWVRMMSSAERGLSRSRNMALHNARGDICILCDDDVSYVPGYEEIVAKAFEQLSEADVIVFNIHSLNPENRPQEPLFTEAKRIPWYKTYSSVHIAFRREKIVSRGITFDERFGTGSSLYSMGEDSLFFAELRSAGLKAYTFPAVIADLATESSSWFSGYNEKYFYDIGAYLSAAYPRTKTVMKYYYPYRFRRRSALNAKEILHAINRGIRGFEHNRPYSATD